MTTSINASDSRLNTITREYNRIIDVLIRDYSPEKVILFGSFAAGQVHEWSDIDLLVVKNTDKPFYERLEEVIEIAQPAIGTDIIVYTPGEIEQMNDSLFFLEEVFKKGRVVYDASQQMV